MRSTIARTYCALLLLAGSSGTVLGQIKGTVWLDGKAPAPQMIDMTGIPECASQHPDPIADETVVVNDKGKLKNVVVSIKPVKGHPFAESPIPKEPALLNQQGCQYIPHVVAMRAGQTLKVTNSDPLLHNVRSLAEQNPAFEYTQPSKGDSHMIDGIKFVETFQLKCIIHPWMSAYIAVFDHPYFAVTGDDGTYTIKTAGLPDGSYTLVFWHEQYGRQEANVTVKQGKGTCDFLLKQQEADAHSVPALQAMAAR